jgi:hypothetical protein
VLPRQSYAATKFQQLIHYKVEVKFRHYQSKNYTKKAQKNIQHFAFNTFLFLLDIVLRLLDLGMAELFSDSPRSGPVREFEVGGSFK